MTVYLSIIILGIAIFGLSIGLHRYFTHRQNFKLSPMIENIILYLTTQGIFEYDEKKIIDVKIKHIKKKTKIAFDEFEKQNLCLNIEKLSLKKIIALLKNKEVCKKNEIKSEKILLKKLKQSILDAC